MIDIKLNNDGDLDISPTGDFQLDDNPLQDARIAILWIEGEWRFNPDVGLPWFEEFLVKNGNPEIVIQQIRNARSCLCNKQQACCCNSTKEFFSIHIGPPL